MKKIAPYFLLSSLMIIVCSCQKRDEPFPSAGPQVTAETSVIYSDSVSFSIDGQGYVFEQRNSAGIVNSAVNIKRSDIVIPGAKLAYQSGVAKWYGTADSTLFTVHYSFPSPKSSDRFKVGFLKKYKDSTMLKLGSLRYAKNNLEIFKLGKFPFAVDYGNENTLDGMVLQYWGKLGDLSTARPGLSMLLNSNLKNDIQDNSTFEITKIQQLEGTKYLIEAKFEVNLIDSEEKLYRAKNGFLRFTTNVDPGTQGFVNF